MKQPRNVLIVEDEHGTRELLKAQLEKDYQVRAVSNGEEALSQLKGGEIDTVLLDLNLPGIGGLEVLEKMAGVCATLPSVIVVSADTNVNTAVKALQRGASDYLVKPFSVEELRATLDRVQGTRRRQASSRTTLSTSSSQKFAGMIGVSASINALKADIEKVADTRGTILLTGESGTGKELAARAIHELSSRARGPYIRINCAAIPESLLEAELFGHEKGAFTNAIARREGMFELADGGTILLDEVTEIDPSIQAKLLRVLQEREIMRLGGKKSIDVDVRVIATTNRDLKAEVREGRFKEDLYYRLNVIPLHIAPLRERPDDIPLLADHFVARAAAENERPVPTITPDAMQRLCTHPWPGNIRELENSLERSVILADGDEISIEDLRMDLEEGLGDGGADMNDASMTIREMEKELILRRLNLTGGNRTRAADMLGISVRTLRNKINQYRGEGVTIPG